MKNLILLLMLLSLNAVWAQEQGSSDETANLCYQAIIKERNCPVVLQRCKDSTIMDLSESNQEIARDAVIECNKQASSTSQDCLNTFEEFKNTSGADLNEEAYNALKVCQDQYTSPTKVRVDTKIADYEEAIKTTGEQRTAETEGLENCDAMVNGRKKEKKPLRIGADGDYRQVYAAAKEAMEAKGGSDRAQDYVKDEYCGEEAVTAAVNFIAAVHKVKTSLNSGYTEDDGVALWNNPGMECNPQDGYAIDYKDCKQMFNTYNGGFVAEQGMNVAGEAQRIGAQRNAAQQAADPNNLQTGALDAMDTVVQKEKSIQEQKAVFYGAFAGTIGTFIAAWKTPKWLSKPKCATELDEVSCKALEDVILGAGMEGYYFPNQGYKGHFTAEMIKHAGNSTMHGILAGQYKKAEDDIDKAKEDVYDLQQREQDLIGLDDCVANPDQPGCNGSGGGRRQIEGVEFGGIEFGGGANSAFNPQALDSGSGGITGNRGTISDADASSIASGLENFADKGASAPKDVAPGAAASKFGGNGGGAGGGGGGGGGGGAAPGLSNINRGGGSKDSGIKIGSSSMKFGKGGFATGGRGAAKSNKNPFSGLLGKKKGKKGGVKVERGLASGIDAKGSKLFEKISKRYGKVIKDNRLEKSDKKL
jgi:hypothetical protein